MLTSNPSENSASHNPPVSERKAAANRANAQRSTGPRTPEGKARASLNALRHGILAKAAFNVTIEGEERRAEFDAIVAGLAQEFQPRTVIEQMTVQQLAGCYWKLAKVWTYEQEAAWRGWATPMPIDEFNEYERHYQGVTVREQVLKHQDEFFHEAGLGAPTIPSGVSARTILRYQGAINTMITRCLTILERRRKERMASDEPFEELDYIKELTQEGQASEGRAEKPAESAVEALAHKRTQNGEADAAVSSTLDASAGEREAGEASMASESTAK